MLAKATKHILEDDKQNKLDPNALPISWNEQVIYDRYENKLNLREMLVNKRYSYAYQ